jgi:hypothetical protein
MSPRRPPKPPRPLIIREEGKPSVQALAAAYRRLLQARK